MKLLVIEDDKSIAKSIKAALSSYGDIDCAYDGKEGLAFAESNIYDCIVLDIMLPEMNGFEVLNAIRKTSAVPVLMLTARGQVDDKVKALNGGADDYLVKPFFKEELCARIEALLRRYNKNFNKLVLTFLDLKLDLASRTGTIGGKEIELPGKLFNILEFLVKNANMIITKEQMFNRIWGFNSDTVLNVVEVYASNLRKILKEFDYHKYLHTVRNVGYMLSEKVENEK